MVSGTSKNPKREVYGFNPKATRSRDFRKVLDKGMYNNLPGKKSIKGTVESQIGNSEQDALNL